MIQATYHSFVDKDAFLELCDSLGWSRGPDGMPSPPFGVNIDTLEEHTDLQGYCVNILWNNVDIIEAFSASRIYPTTPRRVWMGMDP